MSAVYHAISRTKTWCGLDVGSGRDSGPETPVPLVAPDRASVTCIKCLAAMPPEQPVHVKAGEVVKRRLEPVAKRKGKTTKAEEGIDTDSVVRRARATIQNGG